MSPLRSPGRSRVALPGALLALACVSALSAASAPPEQADTEKDRSSADDDWTRRVRAQDRDLETRYVGLVRLRASYPQTFSVALGLMRAPQPRDFDCRTVCDHRGPFVQVEPGLGGLQLGAGYGVLVGERRNNDRNLAAVYVGFGVKGVLLRTWEPSPLDPSSQTFVGIEGDFTITSFNVSLGLMHGVARSAGDDRWIVTGGLGWGF